MLKELLAWWARQMRELLPPGLTGRDDPGQANAIILAPDGTGEPGAPAPLRLFLRRGGRETLLGRFVADEAGLAVARRLLERHGKPPLVLRAGPGALLEREVVLPLAAEREPERVLQYEMDRLTPFRADEVFWTWAALLRDRARGRLLLRLSLVPRTALGPLTEAAAALRVTANAVEASVAGGGVRRIPLAGPQASQASGRRVKLALGCACAVLALVALALPFVRQTLAEQAVSARIAALQPRVAQAEALRRRLASDTGGADVVATERARIGDALQVIATVTDILPDNTFLTDLALHAGKLSVSGQSATAAQLIPALAADPAIRNPAFTAPVTRAENGQADLFSLRAELSP